MRSTTDFLPVAVRLSHSFRPGLLPVAPEEVAELGSMIGRRTVSGPTLEVVSAVVRELSLASWEQSRYQLRPVSWPDPGGSPGADLETARELIGAIEPAWAELVVSVSVLADRVQRRRLQVPRTVPRWRLSSLGSTYSTRWTYRTPTPSSCLRGASSRHLTSNCSVLSRRADRCRPVLRARTRGQLASASSSLSRLRQESVRYIHRYIHSAWM